MDKVVDFNELEWQIEFDDYGRTARRYYDIPKGMESSYGQIDIKGTSYRIYDALDFVFSDDGHVLELEPEPSNTHDKNAIKVNWMRERKSGVLSFLFGDKKKTQIGYIPKELSVKLSRQVKEKRHVCFAVKTFVPESNAYCAITIEVLTKIK